MGLSIEDFLSDELRSAIMTEHNWRGLSGPSEPTPLTAEEVRLLTDLSASRTEQSAGQPAAVAWAEGVRRRAAALRSLLSGHGRLQDFGGRGEPSIGAGRTSLADHDPELPKWAEGTDDEDPLSGEEFDRIVVATLESLNGGTDEQIHAVANWARHARTNTIMLALVLRELVEVRFDGAGLPEFQLRRPHGNDAPGTNAGPCQ